ncbi:hypothetical protein Celal_1114 [Cellulophaga algicola DSM 14237]|uniref:Uncharacterized protein n=1 Tax=Cellulophaga algicola (strain DSM 14237 / IC166 / ACAM 630) TaxID=688270 RepID=E6X5R9_CELAD|nr:hypothetical protein [Cellulophaga algicola]ADV48435.1 hypothetical protein Celal_1114 [Cellulophaga algicola DSM 14237]
MKIIKPEDFPIEMSSENIDILASMALEDVISEEWREITFNILTDEQNTLINNRISEIQREDSKQRWSSLSPKEQAEEKQKIEESMKDQSTFIGNMGEPETLEEFKRRRGYDPRGSKYDK